MSSLEFDDAVSAPRRTTFGQRRRPTALSLEVDDVVDAPTVDDGQRRRRMPPSLFFQATSFVLGTSTTSSLLQGTKLSVYIVHL